MSLHYKELQKKIYEKIRKLMGQLGQRVLTATEKIWSWIGRKNLVLCSAYNALILFQNLQRGFLRALSKLWSTIMLSVS